MSHETLDEMRGVLCRGLPLPALRHLRPVRGSCQGKLPETLFAVASTCVQLFLLLTQVAPCSTPSSTRGLSLLGRKQHPHTFVNTHVFPSDPVTQLTLGNTSQSAELRAEGPRRALLFTEVWRELRETDDSHRDRRRTVAETSPVVALSKWQADGKGPCTA